MQSPNPTSPLKKRKNLKQTTLVLSAAMVGDNKNVLAPSKGDFQAKGKPPKKRGFPESKGKETKRPGPKSGPSRDTTVVDSCYE